MNKDLKTEIENARKEDEYLAFKNKQLYKSALTQEEYIENEENQYFNEEMVYVTELMHTLSHLVNTDILFKMFENASKYVSEGDKYAFSRLLANLSETAGNFFIMSPHVGCFNDKKVRIIGLAYGLFGLEDDNKWVKPIVDPDLDVGTMKKYIDYLIENGLSDETYASATKYINDAKKGWQRGDLYV